MRGGIVLGAVALVVVGCASQIPVSGAADAASTDASVTDAGPADSGAADSGPADAGGFDAGPADAGTFDAGSGDAGDVVACGGGTSSSFPTFDRQCVRDSDCTIGMHQTNCCGSLDAMGIARTDASRFASDEAACEAMYPGCGCFSESVTTDDGSNAPPGSGASAVVLRCVSNVCTTSVRPSTPCDSATCTPTQVCVRECSGIALPPDAGPLPAFCVDVPSACAASSDCSCFGATDPCPTGQCVSVDHGAPLCICA